MTSPKPSNKPNQYTRGWVEFYKLKFKVTPDVLIPRPETELIVDQVIDFIKIKNHPERAKRVEGSLTVLDLGTGSGNIATSIAKNLNLHSRSGKLNIIATDISSKALKVASQNAKLHGVDEKIIFLKSNLLSSFRYPERSEGSLTNVSSNKLRDSSLIAQNDDLIIVTNLPYIPSARIPTLDPSVKNFEPLIALDGGEDGFELYRKLFQQIRLHLSGVKLIVCEIDYSHGELAIYEALKYFPEAKVEVKTDLARRQRILKITAGEIQ